MDSKAKKHYDVYGGNYYLYSLDMRHVRMTKIIK